MGILTELSPDTIQSLGSSIQKAQVTTQESAAQALTQAVYDTLGSNAVLVRLYATVPYGELPEANRAFVAALAADKGVSHELRDGTSVLSLLGTTGKEEAWCSRESSQGHKGIPLTSSSFVQNIPMVAGLLQQMGVGINWLDVEDLHAQVIDNKLSGTFHVPDAATEKNAQGEHVIPAQDFVQNFGVKSVFGIGDAYPNGQICVIIAFCSGDISKESVEMMRPVVDAYVAGTSEKAVFG